MCRDVSCVAKKWRRAYEVVACDGWNSGDWGGWLCGLGHLRCGYAEFVLGVDVATLNWCWG